MGILSVHDELHNRRDFGKCLGDASASNEIKVKSQCVYIYLHLVAIQTDAYLLHCSLLLLVLVTGKFLSFPLKR